jgi:hypothetical protein
MEIDLTNPHAQAISSQAGLSASLHTSNPIDEIPLKGALPTSWDWRTSGIVPAPRDQGDCGGCWAFGTVGIMESAIAKLGGPLTDLSEQFLVSCNKSGWSCDGGLTAHMYHFDTLGLNQTAIGAVLEADDPYTATDGSCTVPYNHPYILSGWQFIVPNEWTMPTVDQIKNAIYTYGPVTAGVCVGSAFQSYTGGIFSTDETSVCPGDTFQTNHQIILVGWDDNGGYWIMRNSWGSGWGESGYMRIAYNTSRVGEGTSWVTWAGATPAPFSKSSPANTSFGQPSNPVLSWEPSSGAASYEYCIDNSSNNICNTSWISAGTSTSVLLSGLASGTHSWQVHAINTAGTTEANAGTWWSFTVGQVKRIYLPVVFRNFSNLAPVAFNKSVPANAATDQSLNPTLSWTVSSNATNYEYCIDNSNNNACDGTWTSTAASTSIGLSDLLPSTSYYWQVRANNSLGTTYADGSSTNYWSFTTAAMPSSGIVNGDFESGSTGWTEYSSNGYQIIVNSFDPTNVTARSGSYAAWMGGAYDETSYVQQQVTISAGAPYLVFWHWIASADYCGFDYGRVLVNGSIVDSYDLCTPTITGGWVKHSVNLSAFVGQTIMLQIRAETNDSLNSNLFIDDVSLQASASLSGQTVGFVPNLDASTTHDKLGIVEQRK